MSPSCEAATGNLYGGSRADEELIFQFTPPTTSTISITTDPFAPHPSLQVNSESPSPLHSEMAGGEASWTSASPVPASSRVRETSPMSGSFYGRSPGRMDMFMSAHPYNDIKRKRRASVKSVTDREEEAVVEGIEQERRTGLDARDYMARRGRRNALANVMDMRCSPRDLSFLVGSPHNWRAWTGSPSDASSLEHGRSFMQAHSLDEISEVSESAFQRSHREFPKSQSQELVFRQDLDIGDADFEDRFRSFSFADSTS